jgi:hypothetical protein
MHDLSADLLITGRATSKVIWKEFKSRQLQVTRDYDAAKLAVRKLSYLS